MTSRLAQVAVTCSLASDLLLAQQAEQLAQQLGLPFVACQEDATQSQQACNQYDMLLVLTADRLALRVINPSSPLAGGHDVWANLTKRDTTSHAGRRLSQPIAKAVGLGKGRPLPTVLDATAGLGHDSWLLASLGCRVLAVEQNNIVAALLDDSLLRQKQSDDGHDVAGRVTLINADALEILKQLEKSVDSGLGDFMGGDRGLPQVVFIDPMFPPDRKTTQSKAMRVLRWLVGDDTTSQGILHAALRVATQRVVVKRPPHAPLLTDVQPTHTYAGKAARYDMYRV